MKLRLMPAALTIVGGLLLLIPACTILFSGVPRVWAPYPMLVVLPAMMDSPLGLLAPSLGFWVLGLKLFTGYDRISVYSVCLFALVGLANLAWFITGWAHGIEYQGGLHTLLVGCFNAALYCLVAFLGFTGRRRPQYWRAFAFHWGFFAWLGWCAFPYLGELP